MSANRKNTAPSSEWVDPDDAPELTDAFFERADLHEGKRLISKAGRPKSLSPKEAVSIRLDADILAHFRKEGPGWQTRMGDALRDWIKGREKV